MDSEQFSLSWNDFHKNLSSGFHSLLEDSTLVDVTLAVEGRKIQAHKVVLSVCSPYFKDLFNGNPCQHPIIFLKDVNYSVIKNLLEFMYLGEVNVRQEELAEFIKTAEDLKIKGLTGSKDKHEECPPVTTQLDSPTHSTTRSGRTVTKRQSSPPASTPTPPPIRKSVPVANTSLNNSTSNKRPKPSTSTSSSLPVKKQCLEPEYIPEPAKPEHIELPNTFGNLKTEPEDYLITEDTLGDDSNLNDPADFPADDTFDNLDTEPQPGGSGEMMTMSADSKEQITQDALRYIQQLMTYDNQMAFVELLKHHKVLLWNNKTQQVLHAKKRAALVVSEIYRSKNGIRFKWRQVFKKIFNMKSELKRKLSRGDNRDDLKNWEREFNDLIAEVTLLETSHGPQITMSMLNSILK